MELLKPVERARNIRGVCVVRRGSCLGRGRGRAAFSLSELMIGLAIIGIMIAGAFSAFGQGMNLFAAARDNTMAAQILQQEVERLRVLSWEELESLPEFTRYAADPELQQPYVDRFHCERILRLRKINQFELVVRVEWSGTTGQTLERTTTTLITRDGLNASFNRGTPQ